MERFLKVVLLLYFKIVVQFDNNKVLKYIWDNYEFYKVYCGKIE